MTDSHSGLLQAQHQHTQSLATRQTNPTKLWQVRRAVQTLEMYSLVAIHLFTCVDTSDIPHTFHLFDKYVRGRITVLLKNLLHENPLGWYP